MIKQLSTTYSKEHCICYDELIKDKVVAVMIEPESGYKLRYADGEDNYDISGFALVNVNAIDTIDCYMAVEKGTETPTEDEELSAEEALSIITGGVSDDESGN